MKQHLRSSPSVRRGWRARSRLILIRLFAAAGLLFVPAGAATPAASPEPVRVIFDTDMGSDCDDAGALALLHHYADLGRVEILACLYSSDRVPFGAAIIDAINLSRGRPHIPIGASHGTDFGDPEDKMNAEKLARDQAAFGHRVIHNRDAEEQVRLARRILAAQPDGAVTYLTVGHTKALHDLLRSDADEHSPLAGRELLGRKLGRWVALGALGATNPAGHPVLDWNFCFNGAAPYTAHLVTDFPVETVFIDAGHDVLTGASLAATPPGDIVRTAYRDWLWQVERKGLADQRPSWDLAAVYYVAEGLATFLEDARPGRLEFDPARGSRWLVGESSHHRFVRQQPHVALAFAEALNQMIAAPAAPR
jgi:hypothetical protein